MRGGGGEGEGVSDRDPRALSSGARLDPAAAERFAGCIRAGGVVLFPADTVYGLACDPCNADAVRRLYELKGRAPAQPAAVMFFALAPALAALPELGPRTRDALTRLLPGPLTVLLPNPAGRFPLACDPSAALTGPSRTPAGEESASAGSGSLLGGGISPAGTSEAPGPGAGGAATLGLRVPLLGERLTALAAIEQPVLQSSANLSGGPEARRLEDVEPALRAAADLVLDGGELPGVASTVLDLSGYERERSWRVLRRGPLSEGSLARVLA